jgi:SP family galactose:H+ symporter-like MFS transporter
MIYFLATVAAIAGFLFGYDEGVIAVVRPSLDRDFPMGPLTAGFMTAAVPLARWLLQALRDGSSTGSVAAGC